MKKLLLITLLTSSVLFCSAQGVLTLGVLAGMELSGLKSKQKMADQYYKNNDFQNAYAFYIQLIKKDSTKTENIRRAGFCLFAMPDNGMKPAQYYNRVLRVKPNDTSTLYDMGVLYKTEASHIDVTDHPTAVEKDTLNAQSIAYLNKAIANGCHDAKVQLRDVIKAPKYQTTWTIENDKERAREAYANSSEGRLKALQDTINNPCLAIKYYANKDNVPWLVTPKTSPYPNLYRSETSVTVYHVIFSKYISDKKLRYTVFLYVNRNAHQQSAKGVTIFLKDGHTISYPQQQIFMEPKEDSVGEYTISAMPFLDDNQLALIKASPIAKFILFNQQYILKSKESDDLSKLLLCIIDRKP